MKNLQLKTLYQFWFLRVVSIHYIDRLAFVKRSIKLLDKQDYRNVIGYNLHFKYIVSVGQAFLFA